MKTTLFIILTFTSFINCFSQTGEKYYDSGNEKFGNEDFKGAIVDYNKAIEVNPKNVDAYTYRGAAKIRLKNNTEAIVDLNKSIEIDPNHGEAYFFRGMAKNNLKDYKGAIADYSKAIDLKYNDAYGLRGETKYSLQDYKGAIVDFTDAIKIDPGYAKAYYWRGLSEIKLGQKDNGCIDLKKAHELGYKESEESMHKYCD